MSEIVATIRKNYIRKILRSNKRMDGRNLTEYREIKIEPNFIKNAEGSAMVSLGNTQVLVGVKAEIGEPYPDSPDKGAFITNAELVPLASPSFEPGPPDENAIELARIIDRGIRHSEALDLKKLVIQEGKKVWIIFIDIHVLNHDGNLFDASNIGAVAALLCTKIPVAKMDGEEITVENKWVKLPVKNIPVTITLGKIDDKLILDPVIEEEEILDAKITICFEKNDLICAVQKIHGPLTTEDLEEAIEIGLDKSREIRKMIEEAVK